MWFLVRYLYLATVVLCIERPKLEQFGGIEKNFHFSRAVDGTRGSQNKAYDSDGSSDENEGSGQMKPGFSHIRYNVPGEPGVDYPVYTRVPKTGFSCQGRAHGYYADEETGCQAFHVCHNVVVSSFICPIGSIFSQNLLICEWWNKVNCGSTTSYYHSHQGIHDIDNEMVHNAHGIIQQAERGGARRGKATNVERQAETTVKFDIEKHRVIANSNARFQPNIVNVALMSKNFAVPQRRQSSGFKFGDTDSSIVHIQQNYGGDSQVSYSSSQPATVVSDFQNFDQQNDRVSGHNFQPSYAPTVPTVTTTTRRMYSPTVPTMHERSTESYAKYVQNVEGSNHPVNPLTTRDRASYADSVQQLVTSRFLNINPLDFDSDIKDRVELFRERPSSSQSNKKNDEPVSNPESASADNGKIGQTNTVRNEEKMEPDISRDRIPPLIIQIPRPVGSSGPPSINIADQIFTFDSLSTMRPLISQPFQPVGGIDRKQTPESPTSRPLLIPQIEQSEDPTRTQISGEVDAGKTVGSPPRIPTLVPQIVQSGVLDATDQTETSQSPTRIPPLISQNSQPGVSLETQISGTADGGSSFDDNESSFDSSSKIPPSIPQITQSDQTETSESTSDESSSDSPSRITPLIPQITQSDRTETSGATGVESSFESPFRIPPLIPQITQSDQRETPGANGDESSFESPSRIPPLIPQITQSDQRETSGATGDESSFESPSRIPPLIPQITQSDQRETSGATGDESSFESPSRIPPLIPQITQSAQTETSESTSDESSFESPSRIPPLIPQISQSDQRETSGATGDESSFELPSRIPPLIPQITQSDQRETSGATGDESSFESPSRIPPLIPQITQSDQTETSESTSDESSFESPSRIPPLIPQITQSDQRETSGATGDESSFESPSRIPPLIPQITQSDQRETSGATGDESSFESPSRIPPLIPQITQSDQRETSGATGDESSFESPSRIPPLIPQITQSDQTETSESTSDESSFESPSRIPPLIPQITQSDQRETSGATGDESSFESPSRIPPLIPQITQSDQRETSGATGDESSVESPSRIPPLIPQITQSDQRETSGATGDESSFESPSRIPPLIPQITQSDQTETSESTSDESSFESPSRIPPLIPQITQSDQTETSESTSDENSFESPSRIPSLIPQITQSNQRETSGATGDESSFESPSRIPPLIPQITQSDQRETSGATGDESSFESPSRIPPLIPQITQSDQRETSGATGDESSFESPSRIPPLIPQITQSDQRETSGATGDESSFESPSRIPPLIPQITQSDQTETSESTSDKSSFESPSRIPPLIPQITQSDQTETSESTSDENSFESPSRIPPLIPQITQSDQRETSGATGDESSFESPSRIPPLIPQITQSDQTETSESTSDESSFDSPSGLPLLTLQMQNIPIAQFEPPSAVSDRTQTASTETSLQIPQNLQPGASSGTDGDESLSDSPPRTSLLIPETLQFDRPSDVTNRDQFSPQYTQIPPLFPPSSQPRLPPVTETTAFVKDDLSGANNRKETSQSPQRIPPLFSQNSQPGASSEVQTTDSVIDRHSSEAPQRIPPLIPQIPDSDEPSTVTDRVQCMPSSTRIVPPFPENEQTGVISESQATGATNDENSTDVPARIPLLISQISPPDSLSAVTERTEPSESSSSTPLSTPQLSGSSDLSTAHFEDAFTSFNRTEPTINVSNFSSPNTESSILSTLGHPSTIPSDVYPQVVQNGNGQKSPCSTVQDEGSTSSQDHPDISLMLLPPQEKIPASVPGGVFDRGSFTGTRSQYEDDLQSPMGGVHTYSTVAPYPDSFTVSRGYLPLPMKSLFPTVNKRIYNQKSASADDPFQFENQDARRSEGKYQNNVSVDPLKRLISSTGSVHATKNKIHKVIRPNGIPSDLPIDMREIETSIDSNDDSTPYQVSVTVNGDEKFNPPEDFISKLLAQQENNHAVLDFGDLGDYEIIKSENPDEYSEDLPAESSFDLNDFIRNQQSEQNFNFKYQNLSPNEPNAQNNHEGRLGVEAAGVHPRPFSFANDRNVGLQTRLALSFDEFPVANPLYFASNAQSDLSVDDGYLLKLGAHAKDINSSLRSLFSSAQDVVETPSLTISKAQILEELKEHFGQPLYYGGPGESLMPHLAGGNIEDKVEPKFANLDQYGVRKNSLVKQQEVTTTSTLPKTSTTAFKPAQTHVETELLPSLSFSFDSDHERRAYAEAVLRGFLADQPSSSPGSKETPSYQRSSKN